MKRLYYSERDELLAFSSHASALALDERYEIQYLAERVAMCSPTPALTVYKGVQSVAPASMVVLEGDRLISSKYWSAYDHAMQPASTGSEREIVDTCRQLFIDAVRLRLSSDGTTWAQLSGGVDSSAIVSVSQWLVAGGVIANGLAGTVTYVDSHGTGADEREYSDAVVSHWQVRNELIIDYPVWRDGQCAPPHSTNHDLASCFTLVSVDFQLSCGALADACC